MDRHHASHTPARHLEPWLSERCVEITTWTWIAFNAFLPGMLALSLVASHSSARVAGWRQVRDRRLETISELLVA